jgi:serine beta-lactamase-like protein LACTB
MMKKSNRSFVGILVGMLLLRCYTADAQIEQALDSVLALRLDSIVRQELGRQDIIGMSVGVVQQGKVAFLKGYGFSDWENRVPVSIESEFRWASLSKSLTSIAALKLKEQGLLNLDTMARAYVPNWPDSAILVRYLLQNRSGIGHYNEMDQLYPGWKKKMDAYQPDTLAWNAVDAVELFREAPLVFRPDSTYLYTTFGFVLAGAVVDQIGRNALGMGYLDMINSYVIQPLGLYSLKPDYTFDENPREVKGYYRNFAGDIRPRQDDDISWKIPGGGYASNIIDLTKYVQGLIHRKLVAPESYQTLWERQRDRDYALGFEVKGDDEELLIAHTGSQNKTRTIFACYPNKGLGVAVMCNTEWANPREVAERLLEALRYSEDTPPAATGQGK